MANRPLQRAAQTRHSGYFADP
ncbi:hypothetical protein VTH06DRAFT_2203 [Thermothelomyces fergusii]